ncbi:MAG: FecR domain-containing protein [Cytophagales bacterium]|nr:FecR domain-containing protein [Cytophagales bacterium]
MMNSRTNELDELIAKYLKGEITLEEKDWLWAELKANAESKQRFDQSQRLWNAAASALATAYEPDVNKAWRRFELRLDAGEPDLKRPAKVRSLARPLLWRAAAAILLVAVAAYVIWEGLPGAAPVSLDQGQQVIHQAGQEVAMVSLKDGSEVWLNQNSSLRLADSFNLDNRVVHLEGEAFLTSRRPRAGALPSTATKPRWKC